MNRKEARAAANELLSTGTPKAEVFAQLQSKGASQRTAARAIACYSDPQLLLDNKWKICFALAFMVAEVIFGLSGVLAEKWSESSSTELLGALADVAALAIVIRAFYKREAELFNVIVCVSFVWIVYSIIKMASPQYPSYTFVNFTILLIEMYFLVFLRNKLFPDFDVISPRKTDGEYVFAETENEAAAEVRSFPIFGATGSFIMIASTVMLANSMFIPAAKDFLSNNPLMLPVIGFEAIFLPLIVAVFCKDKITIYSNRWIGLCVGFGFVIKIIPFVVLIIGIGISLFFKTLVLYVIMLYVGLAAYTDAIGTMIIIGGFAALASYNLIVRSSLSQRGASVFA